MLTTKQTIPSAAHCTELQTCIFEFTLSAKRVEAIILLRDATNTSCYECSTDKKNPSIVALSTPTLKVLDKFSIRFITCYTGNAVKRLAMEHCLLAVLHSCLHTQPMENYNSCTYTIIITMPIPATGDESKLITGLQRSLQS